MLDTLEDLFNLARDRKKNPIDGSYTNKLLIDKNLSKDEFEFVWGKLYTSYINALNKELTYELISENNIMEPAFNLEPSY